VTETLAGLLTALQAPGPSDNDTPWRFFRENLAHADSPMKWLALIFFTMVLTALYLPRLLNAIAFVVAVLALVNSKVRNSQLVRIGLTVFVLGFVALNVAGRFNDNALGVGFLFAFSRPLAAVMMVLGATQALLKRTDQRLNRDIAALVASAESTRPVWPDEPPLPEVDLVASHGLRAGSALVALLGHDLDNPSSTNPPSVHVEQQAELALCKIYRVLPTAGETVRDARSVPSDHNSQVSVFWRRKVSAG
jgi:hypothetical protein